MQAVRTDLQACEHTPTEANPQPKREENVLKTLTTVCVIAELEKCFALLPLLPVLVA